MLRSRNKYRKKWWVKPIRFMNYLAFRYWWFVWSFFIISLLLLYFFCCNKSKNSAAKNTHCPEKDVYFNNMREIDSLMLNCCECTLDTISKKEDQVIDSLERDQVIDSLERDSIPQAPSKNCRAFFSGRLVTDDEKYSESVIFQPNQQSEYVGSGFYPIASQAFPNSDRYTFDGIALVAGTRIIIYENKNFKGRILLDVKGPAIINNVRWKNNNPLSTIIEEVNSKNLRGNLNSIFPKECRRYSDSDMNSWSNGSLKIICSE
jgi:hypothetical protein